MQPSPNALMEFLLCLSFLGNIIATFIVISGSRRTQKREVTFSEEFQPKGEYALAKDLQQIENRLDLIMLKGEERAINLHNRINPIIENTAGIKGQMEAFMLSFQHFVEVISAIKKEK